MLIEYILSLLNIKLKTAEKARELEEREREKILAQARAKIIEEERQRLLDKHAQNLLGYLHKGILR